MTYTMACHSADLVAGIAPFGGNTYLAPDQCQCSQPVHILAICGTDDEYSNYYGGIWAWATIAANTLPYPGAVRSASIWAQYNGCACAPVTDTAATLDLTTDLSGLDTVVTRYTVCPPGGAVELWSIIDGIHKPTLSSQFSPLVIEWLLAHPKP